MDPGRAGRRGPDPQLHRRDGSGDVQERPPDQDAVERCFLNITETVVRLRRHAPDLARRIPDLRGIAGFRNLLAHEYHRIQPERIWDYILDDLPELQLTLKSLLAQAEPDNSQTVGPADSYGSKPDDPDEESRGIIPDPFRTPSPFDTE